MTTESPDNIFLWDMDGTLADFDGAIRHAMAAIHGPDEPPLVDAHSCAPHLRARRRLIRSQPGFWSGLAPVELGFQLLDYARTLAGVEHHLLTKGPETTDAAWVEKKRWRDCYCPDLGLQIVTPHKHLTYGRLLVDDWPEYFMPWLRVRPRGFVICVAHPWNAQFSDHERVVRFDGGNFQQARDVMDHAATR